MPLHNWLVLIGFRAAFPSHLPFLELFALIIHQETDGINRRKAADRSAALSPPVLSNHLRIQSLGVSAASPFAPQLGQNPLLQKAQGSHRVVSAADLLNPGPVFFVNREKLLARAHLLLYPLAISSTACKAASICSTVLKCPILNRTVP